MCVSAVRAVLMCCSFFWWSTASTLPVLLKAVEYIFIVNLSFVLILTPVSPASFPVSRFGKKKEEKKDAKEAKEAKAAVQRQKSCVLSDHEFERMREERER